MKVATLHAALGSAALLLLAQPAGATHSHHFAHSQFHAKKHANAQEHQHRHLTEARDGVQKRGTCSLPDHPDLVTIPGASNNGFAMSPDQPCTAGTYCPIACVPGKVMNQWKPNTTYTYPESMDGGLECQDGEPVKPFPDEPYCVDGTNTVYGENQCADVVSFCQTVLPGNEAMLIPTEIQPGSSPVLAVPGPSYWAGTAAHYYVNPPGVSKEEGCVWGDSSKPYGNWAPYVAGANTDSTGRTFVKIAWNPIYTGSSLGTTKPTFGLSIECPGGGCNGTPCKIDPSSMGINEVDSPDATTGDGGANFCVVTVPSGQTANIVIFNTDGSEASSSASPSSSKASTSSPPPSSTSISSSSHPPSTSSSSIPSSSAPASSSLSSSSSARSASSSSSPILIYPTVAPGIFHENSNSTYSMGSGGVKGSKTAAAAATAAAGAATTAAPEASSTGTGTQPASSTSKNEGAADQGGAAIAGLIVAIVAAAALY